MAQFMMALLLILGILLMLLVLVQRGRGGGLAGALGGMGGQSAFGTKAGDVFTKITVVVATVWVLLAGFGGIVLRDANDSRFPGGAETIEEPGASGEGDLSGSFPDASSGDGFEDGPLILPAPGNVESEDAASALETSDGGEANGSDASTDE